MNAQDKEKFKKLVDFQSGNGFMHPSNVRWIIQKLRHVDAQCDEYFHNFIGREEEVRFLRKENARLSNELTTAYMAGFHKRDDEVRLLKQENERLKKDITEFFFWRGAWDKDKSKVNADRYNTALENLFSHNTITTPSTTNEMI